MSNVPDPTIEFVIETRKKDIGNDFFVRRALPYAKKRMVGPFIFWDHMGPASVTPETEMSVRAHPHIGLATMTYLFDGEIMHRDSLGNELAINPGAINWMVSGKGIVHSERTEIGKQTLEGIQLWVALPKEFEDIEPSFTHYPKDQIPQICHSGNTYTVVAGEALGEKSPVTVHSPMFYVDADLTEGADTYFEVPKGQEGALYVAKGAVEVSGKRYEQGTLLVFEKESPISFKAIEKSRALFFGGEPFAEKRFIWWNLVSSSEEKIEIAKKDWKEGNFPSVINESESIPLPEE